MALYIKTTLLLLIILVILPVSNSQGLISGLLSLPSYLLQRNALRRTTLPFRSSRFESEFRNPFSRSQRRSSFRSSFSPYRRQQSHFQQPLMFFGDAPDRPDTPDHVFLGPGASLNPYTQALLSDADSVNYIPG